MTRLARGDVEMGTGILATNAAHVAEQLGSALPPSLDAWSEDLRAPDAADRLRERLRSVRAGLESDADPTQT